MKYVKSFIKKRIKIADFYYKGIVNDKLRLPFKSPKSIHAFNQFTIRVKNRNKLERYLKMSKVPYGIYYSKPIYRYGAYKSITLLTYLWQRKSRRSVFHYQSILN